MTVEPLAHIDVAWEDDDRLSECLSELAAVHNNLVDVVNALATLIDVLAERVEAIEEYLGAGEPEPFTVTVDVRDDLL